MTKTLGRLALAALIAVPFTESRAQSAGDGFLFGKPNGSVVLRVGFARPTADGDVFDVARRDFTLGAHDLDGANIALDAWYNLTRRIDLGVSLDNSARSAESESRDWTEDGKAIIQHTSFERTGASLDVRFNLVDRGRPISRFAWIPSGYLPYIGAGIGRMRYEYRQQGDFVVPRDDQTADIYTDDLRSVNWGNFAQAFAGVEYTMTPRWSLVADGRYVRGSSPMTADYRDFDKIDLSGYAFTIGTSIRF